MYQNQIHSTMRMTRQLPLALLASTLLHYTIFFAITPSYPAFSLTTKELITARLIKQTNERQPATPASILKSQNPQEKGTRQLAGSAPQESLQNETETSPPVLIAPIEPYFDHALTKGFMILLLNIDSNGGVDSSEVIYSDFPPGITKSIENLFIAADYLPAKKNGKKTEGSIILKVSANN